MGFFSDIFAGGINDLTFQSPSSSVSQKVTDRPSYFTQPTQALLGNASTLASQPYQPYPGARQAPLLTGKSPSLTPFAGQGYSPLGIGQLFYEQAFGDELTNRGVTSGAYSNLAEEAGSGDLSKFMNPYLESVWNPVRADMIRTSTQQGNMDDAAASKVGAFGDYRHGIMEAERLRNLNENLGKTQANIYSQGFNQAGADKMRALGLEGQFIGSAQSARDEALKRSTGIGALMTGEAQKGLDLSYQDFLRQQQDPYDKAKFLAEILKGSSVGMPSSESVTMSGTKTDGSISPTASPFNTAVGTAGNVIDSGVLSGILSLLGIAF